MPETGASDQELFASGQVAGESLADRLRGGPLPPHEALRYAIEIGALLARAHTRGRIHGRLSPQAVLFTAEGIRLREPETGDRRAAPYRAPEQVRGSLPDERSDVFAFGAILHEMLSGQPPFPGEGAQLDREILEGAPPLLPAHGPEQAALAAVSRACLAKDAGLRRQRIRNAVIELKLAGRTLPRLARSRPRAVAPVIPPVLQAAVPARQPASLRLVWISIGLVALVAAAALAAAFLFRPPPGQPALKLTVLPPEHTRFPATPAISPDGRYLAFSAMDDRGKRALWLRSLDTLHAAMLAGTDDAFAPFWSPDSQTIAFFSGSALKRIGIRGGAPQTICATSALPAGGAWAPGGTILFAPGPDLPLFRVAASGGNPEPVTRTNLSGSRVSEMWPQFLPDGRHFLFFRQTGREETSGVFVGDLGSPETRRLLASEASALYAAAPGQPGSLLFLRGRNLMAQPFDAAALQLQGDPALVAEDVGIVRSLALAPLSVSRNGILAYERLGAPTRRLVWFDRSGSQMGTAGEPGEYGMPRISPDGKRVVVARRAAEGDAGLRLIEETGAGSSIPAAGDHAESPVWSPDGSRVVYFNDVPGARGIFICRIQGEVPALLFQDPLPLTPTDWSRDWRYLLFGVAASDGNSQVDALRFPDRQTVPVLRSAHSEGYAALAPDEKWVAYQSDESGQREVYITRFPQAPGAGPVATQVSRGGGGLPRWRADEGELYYMTANGGLMALSVRADSSDLAIGPPRLLFATRAVPLVWNFYDASPDGRRFLVNLPLEWPAEAPITVETDWNPRRPN
ncbi:MAG TPA: hypothetical protein VJ732_01980 [Bryobacteraceae bacterium]|nr:hypothetical protein [Bryobacteraceae bacterium]